MNHILRVQLIMILFLIWGISSNLGWPQEGDHMHETLSSAEKKPDSGMPEHGAEHEEATGHHAFAHPFLVHMGIPDEPGKMSVRMSVTQQALDKETSRDVALHIETGVFSRLGLHLRNDAIKKNGFTEVMVQYAPLQNKRADSGISLFGQIEFPTNYVAEDEDKIIGAFGISARNTFSRYGIVDANVHYTPQESMLEIEASGLLRLTSTIFPIVEFHFERMSSETMSSETIATFLSALKLRIRPGAHLGFGVQFALTDHRDFDNQALAQLDIAY